ncbi:efflux RND transporter permease subunit [Bacillus massiliigorillae]|uniref:efflux RND transporter permease subunit n=1 Tax=Bacillus massiliigorillae TaxID=1243664 RepID=UPI000399D1F9|nr:efflux RND transporter permease subunit [Bacillus massiliigorillae]
MKLSAFSIRRPIFTLVTMIFVLVLGTVSLLNIPLKLIPDINPPVAVVVTTYEGASPTEVSEKVSRPLEANLSTLPGLKNITSTSQEGANLTLLEFSWTTKLDEVENDVLQRLESVRLPDGVEKPRFMKFDPSQFPIIQLTLSSDTNPEALRELADELKLQLLKVNGVANVNLSGTLVKQVSIELDEDKLKTYKLAQSDVVRVISANNVSMPGEKVLTKGKYLTTRIMSSLQSVDDIKKLTLAINPINGSKITVDDVSKVAIVSQNDQTITRTNNVPSVLLSVMQQSDANTASVSEEFQKELHTILKQDQYKDIKSDILFDQGDYISLAIGNISSSLVIGGVLAMLILIMFLRSLKSPIIIGIAIPYSVIVTFVLMYFSNFTLNIMTLGGLALGIGMLVDNSIVVIENIYRHLSMGKDPKVAAQEGAKEVGGAITASTLTTVVVFLPVAFISGIIGDLFLEFALTISFSLFASLYVALSIVPMMASRWLKAPPTNIEKKRKASRSMMLLKGSVEWSLQHRFIVLLITFVLLVAGGLGLTTVGTQFLPNTDEEYFSMRVELENGTAISETEKVVASLEKELKKVEDVDVYVSYIGSTQEGSFRGNADSNRAEIYVKLVDLDKRDQSVFRIVDDMKKDMEQVAKKTNPTAEVSFVQQSTHGSAPNTLTFSLRDTDKNRLDEGVRNLQKQLKTLKDVSEVETNLSDKVEEVQVVINREKALQHGFVPAQIASITNDVTRGAFATQIVNSKGDVQSVLVQYDQNVVENIESLRNLAIKKTDGTFIALKDVANFYLGESPVKIQRINNQDAVQFTVKYKSNATLGDVTEQVEKAVKDVNLAKQTELVYSGDKELLDTATNQMGLAFILAIIFIYLVMAAQFESLKYPFVIMFSVPLFIIGVAIALTTTRTPIGITAIIGIIVLAGIVVNNAIVIVDYINQRKQQGLSSYEAIVSSVLDRARPILMTSLTTILGLVPIALGIGEGTELNQPMGITVIGGLISSTFLTLFVIPIIYSFFDKQTRKKARFNRQLKINDERDNVDVEIEKEKLRELRELVKSVHHDNN